MKRAQWMIIVFALLAAACGGGDDAGGSTGIPTLEDTSRNATTTTQATLEGDEALLVFSQCMRDEGIPLPDIGVDADGAPLLDPALLDVIDIESDEFTAAFEKCQPILSQSRAFNIDIDPALQAQIEDQLFDFSQCMRDNGFEDFPDPGSLESGQPYPLTVLAQFEDPAFEAAVELCQRELAFPGFGGGDG
jgi:hypothetical protein